MQVTAEEPEWDTTYGPHLASYPQHQTMSDAGTDTPRHGSMRDDCGNITLLTFLYLLQVCTMV